MEQRSRLVPLAVGEGNTLCPSPPRALPAATSAPLPISPRMEIAAILELAHAIKASPADYRLSLDARQMVMFFEKASLRTRLTFEAGMNTLGGSAMFVDQTQSPLGQRESLADMARNVERWVSLIVLRTYAHETITDGGIRPVPGD